MTGDSAHGGLRILLVEDAELVRESTTLLLEGLGHEVLAAENGPEALGILERDGSFDLLMTDVIMPGGMGGQEIADAAVARDGAIKVLMFSASPRAELLARGRIREDTPLLSKPFRKAQLELAVQELFGDALA